MHGTIRRAVDGETETEQVRAAFVADDGGTDGGWG
jgi:hypothetical protein